MTRPARYKENNSSRDWIDEFCATSTVDESRGAFRFTIGKYLRRYGKKDDPLQEALKIQDYANRLVEFERAARAEQDGWTTEAIKAAALPPEFGQQHTIEPASLIDDESPRMQAIGQNGPSGEHYDELLELAEVAILNGGAPLKEPHQPRHRCLACGLGHATHECGAGL